MDQMINNRYGLLYTLFSIINHKEQSDAEYAIAKYLLENYKKIGKLNIYDVSESCNVSRFTVRRFCEAIGFENFSKMKKQFIKYDDEYLRYQSFYHRDDFSNYLSFEVKKILDDNDKIPKRIVKEIAKKIHESSKVVFLTSTIGATAVTQFQQGMLFSNKIIHVVSDHFDNHSLLNSLDEDDLIIVLSGSARLAKSLIPNLKKFNVQTMLLTMNENIIKRSEYDYIYSIIEVLDEENFSILHIKYSFMFFLDLLLSSYITDYTKGD